MDHRKRDNKTNKNNKTIKAGLSEQKDNRAGSSENAPNSEQAGSEASVTSGGPWLASKFMGKSRSLWETEPCMQFCSEMHQRRHVRVTEMCPGFWQL